MEKLYIFNTLPAVDISLNNLRLEKKFNFDQMDKLTASSNKDKNEVYSSCYKTTGCKTNLWFALMPHSKKDQGSILG